MVKRLLKDVTQMPLFGLKVTEFKDQLIALAAADQAALEAAQDRSLALTKFINWAASSRGRVIGTYLEDVLFEFYE